MNFDKEGVPTRKNEVIKNGELLTYLHNLKTAHKYGVEPTGNGAGSNSTMETFFYMEPGEKSFEELLADMREGFIVSMINRKKGVNLTTGNLSLEASGFMVKGGKIVFPVENFTIAGNFYELFKDIRAIGRNFETECYNVGSPSVLVDGLTLVCK